MFEYYLLLLILITAGLDSGKITALTYVVCVLSNSLFIMFEMTSRHPALSTAQ
jgi:hypothetical protein